MQLLSPSIFLPIICILCAVVGISLGSAWTVTATLGVAFMAIGITTMCDQYLGLIIPASMYKDKYDEMGMGRNMLS